MSDKFIPYGRHVIDASDIDAVVNVLQGDWLTTGPVVVEFERAFAAFVDAGYAIAVSNGTAALHLCMLAAGIGPGDEVIVPALTFAASANCARYVGATVVFADISPDTLTINPEHVESLITPRTRAIVAVDYAGLPCDLDRLLSLAQKHKLILVEDACHAPGAEYRGRKVGSIAHMSAFSLHPVKHMTSGEGGVVTTNDAALADRVRKLRSHGISSDHRQREANGTWLYDMSELGFNYRLCDIQCALALSQLKKLPQGLARRRQIATNYGLALGGVDSIRLLAEPEGRKNAWHLYPVRVLGNDTAVLRKKVFEGLRASGIGANVHYLPVYLHSYYQSLGYRRGLCMEAEKAYDALLSLPMWHGLEDADQIRVVANLIGLMKKYG
jgi:perosamine synthetase